MHAHVGDWLVVPDGSRWPPCPARADRRGAARRRLATVPRAVAGRRARDPAVPATGCPAAAPCRGAGDGRCNPVAVPAPSSRGARSERVVGPAGDGRAALDATSSGNEAGTRPIRSRGEEIMMDGSQSRAIVVGVDESASARDAAEWAADVAALWAAPLHLVHVVLGAPYDSPITLHPSWLTELCASAVRAGADPEDTEVIPGNTVDMLADRAAEARMLVLGSYGTGAWSGMLAGSVALAADRAGPLPGRCRPRQRTADPTAAQRTDRRRRRRNAVRAGRSGVRRRSRRCSGPGWSPCTPGPTWPLTAHGGLHRVADDEAALSEQAAATVGRRAGPDHGRASAAAGGAVDHR